MALADDVITFVVADGDDEGDLTLASLDGDDDGECGLAGSSACVVVGSTIGTISVSAVIKSYLVTNLVNRLHKLVSLCRKKRRNIWLPIIFFKKKNQSRLPQIRHRFVCDGNMHVKISDRLVCKLSQAFERSNL